MATMRTTPSTPHCSVSLSVISALFLPPLTLAPPPFLLYLFFLPFLFAYILAFFVKAQYTLLFLVYFLKMLIQHIDGPVFENVLFFCLGCL